MLSRFIRTLTSAIPKCNFQTRVTVTPSSFLLQKLKKGQTQTIEWSDTPLKFKKEKF